MAENGPQAAEDQPEATAPSEITQEAVPGAAAGDTTAQGEASGKQQDGTGLLLPISRIKKMMKEGHDVKIVSADASWAVARAAELFMQELTARAHATMAADGSRKGLEYKDLAAVVSSWPALDFLSEVVPPKVKIGDVREQLQKQLDEYTPKVFND